uniref:Zinc finger CCCH domain-containing protein 41 n=1 Tax=Kalanchoe fedtschenkoi TaxID=63787 RepID=A0A7N0VGG2_KALFE
MELKLSSSRRPRGPDISDSDSDPDREFSGDDDDDDRNHKHRRREIKSQSSEFDGSQSVSSRTFNKRNKPFENGRPFRENDSQTNGGWKNNNFNSERDLKSDKRRFDLPMFSRPQMDANQRTGFGQTYFGESGFARGRGRESWHPHAPRFGSMEFSQTAQQGSVSSNIITGRGLPNVAGVQNAPWNPYGLLPGIPTGSLDAMHSIGVNSALRPPINPPTNIGIIRQKCRDFEERGFCLRGDMCPMEHGVNRIVVDDVQSLSKFNLPVSLSGGNTLGVGVGSGPLPAGIASASFSGKNNKMQSKMVKSKSVRKGSGAGSSEAFSNSAAAGNDFYDPDQPLWNKDAPGSSTVLSQPCSPEIQQDEPVLHGDISNSTPVEVRNDSGIHLLSGNACSSIGTHDLTLNSLGSMHGSKSRSDVKGKVISMPNLSGHCDSLRAMEDTTNKVQSASVQGIQPSSEDKGTNGMDASQKRFKGSSRNTQKPLQKAMRTIFVNGIPQKDNNKEALKSHFQKFGEIIDIYIPSNSEKAFVQFSKREEAEAALKAPDAVMGNRFIKLWWANRDSIPDAGINIGTASPHVGTAYSGPNHFSISSKGRINKLAAPKANMLPVSSTTFPLADQGKHVVTDRPVALAPSQKKLESLEVLKEELRKKQELLDQKRNEFKRQLDRLEKQKQVQAAGVKGELSLEQPAKRHKVAMATDAAKPLDLMSADINTSGTLSRADVVAEKTIPVEKPLVHDPSRASTLHPQEAISQKMLSLPLTTTANVLMNRSKLDNQPKAFRIVPPLPSDFADMTTMREHFSPYGEVYDVELINVDMDERRAAVVSFDSHCSAEKAFQGARNWKGHDLQFIWVMSGCTGNDATEQFSSSAKEPMDVDITLQDSGLQEFSTPPVGDLNATATNSTCKTAPDEKRSPCEKTLENQPFEDDAHKELDAHLPEEDVEKKLSEDVYAVEKTLEEKSSDEAAERGHDEQPSEDNVEWTPEEQLSDRDVDRAYEEYPSRSHVDHIYKHNEQHSVEEYIEKTSDNQSSEDDVR